MELFNKTNEILEDIVKIRRNLHKNPELGYEVIQTSALVKSELSIYGVDEILCPGKNAVIGVIKGKKGAGKCIGLRCDMDALPVVENTGLSFCSVNRGIMHACGHDLHTAMMLGIAKILCDMRDQFSGAVKVIFEPGEETQPGGALGIIESGRIDDVDAFLATHVIPTESDVGLIGLKKGSVTTSADEVLTAAKRKRRYSGRFTGECTPAADSGKKHQSVGYLYFVYEHDSGRSGSKYYS